MLAENQITYLYESEAWTHFLLNSSARKDTEHHETQNSCLHEAQTENKFSLMTYKWGDPELFQTL